MLATRDDLYAVGALSPSAYASTQRDVRADTLLELVSAQVVAGLGYTSETLFTVACNSVQLRAIAGVVASAVKRALNQPEDPSFDPTAILNRRDWRSIRRTLNGGTGNSHSVVVGRDADSSWLGSTTLPHDYTGWNLL